MGPTDRVHPVELVGWLVVALAVAMAALEAGQTLAGPLVVLVAAPLVFLGVVLGRLRER